MTVTLENRLRGRRGRLVKIVDMACVPLRQGSKHYNAYSFNTDSQGCYRHCHPFSHVKVPPHHIGKFSFKPWLRTANVWYQLRDRRVLQCIIKDGRVQIRVLLLPLAHFPGLILHAEAKSRQHQLQSVQAYRGERVIDTPALREDGVIPQ
jgi:hypothetical protein